MPNLNVWSQTNATRQTSFMFYNTENLFDCFDDSLSVGDDEFLPDGNRHWTYKRYKEKLSKISKVVLAAGEWSPPAIVGLCEIENESVMHQLINWTGLKDAGYRFVHYESPDPRGIDVALLYRRELFKVLSSKAIPVALPNDKKTRDILMVKGILNGTDTLFVFVNHWPSRLGGEEQSSANRNVAAQTLSTHCDSLRSVDTHAQIIVMGDFNDGPHNASIQSLADHGLVNLALLYGKTTEGSNKYRQDWELIDQIFMSEGLMENLRHNSSSVNFRAVTLPFLLESDAAYLGQKPFRTYVGPNYNGGFSDHLPVIATVTPLHNN